jgi:hypothetical protein
MLKKWLRILKTGTFTDRHGTPITISPEMLERVVSNYNPELSETPLVVGHPKHDAPAYGWVEKFKVVGDELLALPKQVAPEFTEAVKAGRYKKISCAIREDGSIRHIGFLGAEPPAVKGLGSAEFSDGDKPKFEVELGEEEWRTTRNLFLSVVDMLRRLRDKIIDEDGVDAADKVAHSSTLDWMLRDLDNLVEKPREFSEPFSKESGVDIKQLEAALEKATKLIGSQEDTIAQLSEKSTSLEDTVTELKSKLDGQFTAIAEGERKRISREFAEFCEPMVSAGAMTPYAKSIAVELCDRLQGVTEVELSEGDGEAKKVPAVEALKGLLSALPHGVELGEVATRRSAGGQVDLSDSDQLLSAAQDYQLSERKKGREVGIAEAVTYVQAHTK